MRLLKFTPSPKVLSMENNFEMLAKTLFGLEPVLADELKSIGASEIQIVNRAVAFKGDQKVLYKANYYCRTALRILVPIKSFTVTNQEELYQEISKISWDEYMEATDTLAIDSVITASEFTNSMFVSLKAKDAIVDQFRNKYSIRPSIDLDHPTLRVNIHIFKETCTVSLDSSGSSLHKRGYRGIATKAPLNEVLASGLILLSGWDKKSPFVDPMCGSGTIVIEAALIAKNYPAGYFRKEFGFEKWKNFNRDLWEDIILEGEKNIISTDTIIRGSDNARSSVRIAKENVRDAGLRDVVEIEAMDFTESQPPQSAGVVIMNPPYGERLDKDEDIFGLYKSIGDTLKSKYEGYDAWVLSSNIDALKSIGLRHSRRITVFNGPLECKFVKFEMYRGTKKLHKINPSSE